MFNAVGLEVKMPFGLYCNEAIPPHQDFSEQRNKKQDIQSLSTASSVVIP
ncbi:hypothetical protein [Vibrio crassostreae]|nr:hypothetical protein [Vibrio crassostreae]